MLSSSWRDRLDVGLDDQIGIGIVAGRGHHQVLRAVGAAEFEPAVPVARDHALDGIAVAS